MYDTTNAYDSLYYMQLESGKFVAKATIVSAKAAVKFTKKSDGFKIPVYVVADKSYPIFDGKQGWIRKAHANASQFAAIKAYEQNCQQAWQQQNEEFEPEEDETNDSDGFFGYHEHNFANDRNSGHVVG